MGSNDLISPVELIALAANARQQAYAPYSRFTVGAAVLTADGRVFLGANVENASYGLTICAERVAAFTAAAEGALPLVACAVVAGKKDEPAGMVLPCGACLQVLLELSSPVSMVSQELIVYTVGEGGAVLEKKLSELLPSPFKGT
ncbi:cytidine deaminase [bacterium]|nr:cytidine deaminase [bacterium]